MRTKSFKLDQISEKEARCSRCKIVKTLDHFRSNKGQWAGKKFRISYCNECRAFGRKQYANAHPLSFFKSKISQIKVRALKKKLDFDLTADFLLELFEKQRGLCFYSDQPMKMQYGIGKQPSSISVDRVDTTKGYTRSNVVLCIDRINSIKSDLTLQEVAYWLPKIYERIVNYQK